MTLGDLCAAIEEAGGMGDLIALKLLLPQFKAEMAQVDGFLRAFCMPERKSEYA
jgi:hypothetical protein